MHRGSISILRVTFLEQPANIILLIIVYLHIRFSSNQYLQGCPGIQGNTVTLSGAGYPCYFDLKKCSWKLFSFLFLTRKWKLFTCLISIYTSQFIVCMVWTGPKVPRVPDEQTSLCHRYYFSFFARYSNVCAAKFQQKYDAVKGDCQHIPKVCLKTECEKKTRRHDTVSVKQLIHNATTIILVR